jgi:hypothetical protein
MAGACVSRQGVGYLGGGAVEARGVGYPLEKISCPVPLRTGMS